MAVGPAQGAGRGHPPSPFPSLDPFSDSFPNPHHPSPCRRNHAQVFLERTCFGKEEEIQETDGQSASTGLWTLGLLLGLPWTAGRSHLWKPSLKEQGGPAHLLPQSL